MMQYPDVFAPVALSHICDQVADLVSTRVNGRKAIELNTSAQPNSNPHLGTVSTIFSAFSLGEHLQERTGVPVRLTFDYLENARGSAEVMSGATYQRSLADTLNEDGRSKLDCYLPEFERLIRFASVRTGVDAIMQSYSAFQATPAVRGFLLKMVQRRAEFQPLLGTREPNIHVRFPCPVCGRIEKDAASLRVKEVDQEQAVLSMDCPIHGRHVVTLSVTTDSYIDTGTAVRDVVKMAALAVQAREKEHLAVMMDGVDWGGAWAWNVSALGATMLGVPYDELPIRYFSPAILDVRGAKFSKSVFVASGTYDYLPREYLDSRHMYERHGEPIFERLLQMTRKWMSDPTRFFRNYSIDYVIQEIS
ncbi:hypothetical protein ABXK61_13320 [Burkholderia sola]|uniref:hypothetical protein n=1 Tax=Burkholderia TaxID=32008 RepID=UPI001AE2985E|nr:hypothetical protein [Burkholderia sp. AcTa6-5]MBP0714293.1 hypothetical protein [Burkholderia sp. AcTa6-5]